mgnify:CR=1 FL=1
MQLFAIAASHLGNTIADFTQSPGFTRSSFLRAFVSPWFSIFALVVVFGATSSSVPAFAAEQKVYQPQGAPADPKVDARWNRYHDYAQATELLKKLAAAHPDRARLISLGKSYDNRELWLMTIHIALAACSTTFTTNSQH